MMQEESAVRDGILDAQAALLANARTWKKLAWGDRLPPAVWREVAELIAGERRAVGYLRSVAAAAEEAAARPRRPRRVPKGMRARGGRARSLCAV